MNYGADWTDLASGGIEWTGNIVRTVVGGKTAERQLALQRDILAMQNGEKPSAPPFDFAAIAPYAIGGVIAIGLLTYVLTRKK